jgi:hypothetical protein
MATKLLKDITREALAVTNMRGEIQIVTLKAGDMLQFRPKGRRTKYEVPLQACYNMALIYSAQQWYKERIAKYIQDKKNGRKVKRPRPLPPIFNSKLYEALRIK